MPFDTPQDAKKAIGIYLQDLKRYFYFYQYDEEKYPHFRACDIEYEVDMEGDIHYYYCFYED